MDSRKTLKVGPIIGARHWGQIHHKGAPHVVSGWCCRTSACTFLIGMGISSGSSNLPLEVTMSQPELQEDGKTVPKGEYIGRGDIVETKNQKNLD